MNVRRLALIALASVLTLVLATACRVKEAALPDPMLEHYVLDDIFLDEQLLNLSSDEGVTDTTGREIVCWGDSMTFGVGASEALIDTGKGLFDANYLSYPEVLQRLTGIKTYKFGVPGATSEEIAAMQGALELDDVLDGGSMIDELVREARMHTGDVLVIEMGSNGGWDGDYDTLIAQYDAMIEHAGCDDFLIIGDTDDPGTSIGDEGQMPLSAIDSTETDWEAALSNAYGDKFINMRAFLVDQGLSVAGLEEEPEDVEAAAEGCVSSQLRADWTHLNSYGYYAKAVAVHERGAQLGYW